ncbi:flagellar biosynthetic protein FliO [Litorivicinus lipolyticus]|uniref:Flagellar protein n=1 Tax=Litorivicinus lipolyticus TaxID=418701 RepID=A0A5Q2QAI4_9GAMM|nr:flagellar biosynthetic protein FliO [Litorivicinus lipolyticus]QGG80253.1 flagellar biosynthetic protein FliO [Litorivicinus lipolyticus]
MDAGNLFGVFAALIVVLGVIVGGAYLIRRFGGQLATNPGPLRVLSSINVGTRERVVLIQAGDEQLLLGVAPGRVELLKNPTTPIDVPAPAAFAQSLSSALNRGRQ